MVVFLGRKISEGSCGKWGHENINTSLIYIVNTSLKCKYCNIYISHKYLIISYLNFRPACDPLVCSSRVCLAYGGPDEWCVGSIGIVAVCISPRVDEVVC